MARPRNHQAHFSAAVEDLLRSVTRLMDPVGVSARGGGRRTEHGKGRRGRGTGRPAVQRLPGQRGPGKGNPKLKSKLKAYWAGLSPAERKARIEKMHAWRKANK